MARYDFTDAQVEAIGQLVCDNWNADIQTGWIEGDAGEKSDPMLFIQQSPNSRIRNYFINGEGTVVEVPGIRVKASND